MTRSCGAMSRCLFHTIQQSDVQGNLFSVSGETDLRIHSSRLFEANASYENGIVMSTHMICHWRTSASRPSVSSAAASAHLTLPSSRPTSLLFIPQFDSTFVRILFTNLPLAPALRPPHPAIPLRLSHLGNTSLLSPVANSSVSQAKVCVLMPFGALLPLFRSPRPSICVRAQWLVPACVPSNVCQLHCSERTDRRCGILALGEGHQKGH
ncbi:unnamed protein product [Protopolystoma xenopodis]|uniref:Uncharacterized protein n=1 Tax=Protopolystoma xenopodis TaxID=117903 RepID=A0A3S5B1U1_9PLAT|nr:unnamed protein product [Protopolystoma xenopodis]